MKPTHTATEAEAETDLNLPSLDELNLTPDVAPILEGEDDPSRDCSWFCCTSNAPKRSLESWELQLLRVSLELKMKLKDPHFVAKRCDLDSSGDLDLHE